MRYQRILAAVLAAGLSVLSGTTAFAAQGIGPGYENSGTSQTDSSGSGAQTDSGQTDSSGSGSQTGTDTSGSDTQSDTAYADAWKKVDGAYRDSAGNAISGAILRGVSVSKWQGSVDWNQVKADDVSFAWIRMGSFGYEGEYTMDEYFDQNMRNAAAAGIHTAPYVYLQTKTVDEAKAAAQYTADTAKNYTVDYPIAVDVESSYILSLSVQELTDVVNAFCQVIAENGYTPIIYSDYNKFMTEMDITQFPYDIWLARYGTNTELQNRTVWQCTQEGQIAGISGNVCIEIAFQDYAGGQSAAGTDAAGSGTAGTNAAESEGPGAFLTDGAGSSPEPGSGGPAAQLQQQQQQAAAHVDGWDLTDGVWHYYEGGAAVTGWKKLDNVWYYLDPANGGAMLSGTTMTIDGTAYSFDGSGAML